jgi:hypothetical protein
MRSRGLLSVCLLAAQTVIGQTRVSLKNQGKEADFSEFSSVRPFRTGTTLPANCVTGEMFFKTDAPAGSNLYGCVAGSWVQQGSGGSGNGSPVLSVFGRTGHVTAQAGDYSFSQILGLVSNAQIGAGVDAAKIGSGTVDNTEFGYLDGVSSPIQAQLNSKAAASHSHTAAGDVAGDLGNTTVQRIRGRTVSTIAPTDGQVLAWSAATSEWVPATISGGGGGGGGATSTPLDVTRSTATDLSVGSNCSLASPCRVRVGSVVYSFTAAATATVTSGSGTAFIYVAGDGALTVGIPASGMAVTCNGCTTVAGVSSFPMDAVPVYEWAASSAQWASTGTDRRSILSSGRRFAAGPGIVVSESGNLVTISATGGGGGGAAYVTVQDEGSSLPQRSTLNFTGGGVSCADDATNGRTTCSIPNAAGGDLSGTLTNATVAKLQGRTVASTAPSNGQVLTWNGTSSQWEPQTPPSGGVGGGMPALFTQKMLAFGLPGNTSMNFMGMHLNVDGTQSLQAAASSVPHRAIRYTSGATSGSDAGLTAPSAHGVYRMGEVLRVYAGVGSTVNVRFWLGLSGMPGLEMGSDTPNQHQAAFRYSTAANDTNFQCVTCLGGAACTVTDSGVAADTNRHLFEVAWTGSAFQFRIDGNTVCTNTTNLPGSGQTYGPIIRLRTLEAAAKTLDIGGIYLEKNF